MPSTIACPGCQRALTLPAEAMNRQVQCPACKHQFHPAEAEAAAIRTNLPKVDFSAPKADASLPEPTRVPSRAPRPPLPQPDESPRRSRRKRVEYDMCPKCDARVPPHAERCPECGVEFVAEKDEDFRPWERTGEERRDSEPHRGTMILLIGIGSIVLSLIFMCPGAGLFATIVGIIAGIVAVTMGRADLRKIDQRIMAAEGRSTTHGGVICGTFGIIMNLLAMIPAAFLTVQWFWP